MAIIGGIPHFQTYPYCDFTMVFLFPRARTSTSRVKTISQVPPQEDGKKISPRPNTLSAERNHFSTTSSWTGNIHGIFLLSSAVFHLGHLSRKFDSLAVNLMVPPKQTIWAFGRFECSRLHVPCHLALASTNWLEYWYSELWVLLGGLTMFNPNWVVWWFPIHPNSH